VQVHCDEGVATHIGPEPCVYVRENIGEASAGGRIGQPLSRERIQTRMPTLFTGRKARRTAHVIASARTIRRGRRTGATHMSVRGHAGRYQPEVGAVCRGVDSLNTHSAKRPEMDVFKSFSIQRSALERIYLKCFLRWANQGEGFPCVI
jgi:hypothetical protein